MLFPNDSSSKKEDYRTKEICSMVPPPNIERKWWSRKLEESCLVWKNSPKTCWTALSNFNLCLFRESFFPERLPLFSGNGLLLIINRETYTQPQVSLQHCSRLTESSSELCIPISLRCNNFMRFCYWWHVLENGYKTRYIHWSATTL